MSITINEFINDINAQYWLDTKTNGYVFYWGSIIFASNERFDSHKKEECIKIYKNKITHYQMFRDKETLFIEGITINVNETDNNIYQIKLKPESLLHRFLFNVKLPFIDKVKSTPSCNLSK